MAILIKNGFVITADESAERDILIRGEQIDKVAAELQPSPGDKIIDASGKYIFPGGVDPHTHLDLPVGCTRSSDDFYTGQRAAAFGGTTTHIDFANQTRGSSLESAVNYWMGLAEGKAVIDYGFHISVTDPCEAVFREIPSMLDRGIASVKVFLAYKGLYQIDDLSLLRILEIARENGMILLVHAENGDAIAWKTEQLHREGRSGLACHNLVHSEPAEFEAIQRIISFTEISGAPVYIVHIASGRGVRAVSHGRKQGLPVLGETCVQYTYLTGDSIDTGTFEGAKYICSPPPKSGKDRDMILTGLLDGSLQTVATDHCPFWFDGTKPGRIQGKELGKDDWSAVPNGVPGIEDRFPVMWQLGVVEGGMSPSRFVELLCTNPARIFGLYPRKGTIAPGSDADLVIFDPNIPHVRSVKTHHMQVDYNVYEGVQIQGTIEKVFLRGTLIVDGETWLGVRGSGNFLPRSSFSLI